MMFGKEEGADPMEILMSMTASLMEKQPKEFNPVYTIKQDPIRQQLKIGGKPPREIFYRDTLTYMTKLPPPAQPKLCTCKYYCSGDRADYICHSCAVYSHDNSAYFCKRCYDARHPWYREPHISTEIENDESIAHTLKTAHRMAEAHRYEMEGSQILKKLQAEKPKLEYVKDDEKVDDQLHDYGRKVTALEEHVLKLRQSLQDDIHNGDARRRQTLYSREKDDKGGKPEEEDEDERNTNDTNDNNQLAKAPFLKEFAYESKFFESDGLLFAQLEDGTPDGRLLLDSQENVQVAGKEGTRMQAVSPPKSSQGGGGGLKQKSVSFRLDIESDLDSNRNNDMKSAPLFRAHSYQSSNSSGSLTFSPGNSPSQLKPMTSPSSMKKYPKSDYNNNNSTNAQQKYTSGASSAGINFNESMRSAYTANTQLSDLTNEDGFTSGYIGACAGSGTAALGISSHLPRRTLPPAVESTASSNMAGSDAADAAVVGEGSMLNTISEITPWTGTGTAPSISSSSSSSSSSAAGAASAGGRGGGRVELSRGGTGLSISSSSTRGVDEPAAYAQEADAEAEAKSGVRVEEAAGVEADRIAADPAMHRVMSGISFTSVAHGSDIDADSIHMATNRSSLVDAAGSGSGGSGGGRLATPHSSKTRKPTHDTAAAEGALQSATSTSLDQQLTLVRLGSDHHLDQTPDDDSISALTTSSSVHIQRLFKGYIARRAVSKLLTTRLVRVFDQTAGRDYYYDKHTGASTWEPPKLLKSEDKDSLEYYSPSASSSAAAVDGSVNKLWVCKRACPRRRNTGKITKKIVALTVLRAFARCILARKRVLSAADTRYRRVYDEDTSSYYYADVFSGETSWYKSKVYLHIESEPPVYRVEIEGVATAASNNATIAIGNGSGNAEDEVSAAELAMVATTTTASADASGANGGTGSGSNNSKRRRSPRVNRV